MYRRYQPRNPHQPVQHQMQNTQPQRRAEPPQKTQPQPSKAQHNQHQPPKETPNPPSPPEKQHIQQDRQRPQKRQSPLVGLIPPTVYNPETKKVLGFLSAEDLLLIALIFLFLDNDENNDPMIIYALLYILISDYVDLGDLFSI